MGEVSGGEEHSESVVVAVSESAGQAAVEFDDPVEGLGGSVVDSVGGEVRQERVLPPAQGPSQAGDLGDWACVEGVQDLQGDVAPRGRVLGLVGLAQLVDGLPSDVHLLVCRVG